MPFHEASGLLPSKILFSIVLPLIHQHHNFSYTFQSFFRNIPFHNASGLLPSINFSSNFTGYCSYTAEPFVFSHCASLLWETYSWTFIIKKWHIINGYTWRCTHKVEESMSWLHNLQLSLFPRFFLPTSFFLYAYMVSSPFSFINFINYLIYYLFFLLFLWSLVLL